MLDFMALDLHLYLNTHPQDSDALALFSTTTAKAAAARDKYEAAFGPLTAGGTAPDTGWPWIDNPWPWQACYNFSLERGPDHVGI